MPAFLLLLCFISLAFYDFFSSEEAKDICRVSILLLVVGIHVKINVFPLFQYVCIDTFLGLMKLAAVAN